MGYGIGSNTAGYEVGPTGVSSPFAYGNGGHDPNQQAPSPQFGGYNGGANDTANQMSALAAQARGAQVNPNLANAGADRQMGLGALGALGATAQGGGAAQQVANAQFGQNLNTAMQAQAAAANSARGGGAALASAQQNAQMQQAQMAGQGAQQAAALRGNLTLGAQQQYAALAQQQQGMDTQQAMGVAGLQQRQGELNNAASMGYLGLGNQVELGQLGADSGTYGSNLNFWSGNAANSSSNTNAAVGAGAGVMMGLAAM